MRRPLIVGNWKMNGDMTSNEMFMAEFLQSAEGLLSGRTVDLGFAVPAPYLFQAAVRFRGRGVLWGAQDVSSEARGAFTGEISAAMLQDFEASFSLVGHSERRARSAESNASVRAKVSALLGAGLTPIICVGETTENRERGEAQDVVAEQVREALPGASGLEQASACVFSYEPIWAIGTGRTASPVEAQTMHVHIREVIDSVMPGLGGSLRILYGGSVTADNAESLLSQQDVDGALVGGASLKADQMSGILRAAVACSTAQ